ncbi:MAG: DUF4276 family protein [Candidatus Sumerlaeaceae bacterium]|nr:DUF4276 family protein [Candidatus Sumerlaeaceae bacterium]
MKVWVFVEGEADRLALLALWDNWRHRLQSAGWGIAIVPLKNKSCYLQKLGPRAAEKLVRDEKDLVVGLPDLYPNHDYLNTKYEHADLPALQKLQKLLVQQALTQTFNLPQPAKLMDRFFPSALKHDLEVLLLASLTQLRKRLKTNDQLGNWQKPPENQNQQCPPRDVIEHLFSKYLKRSYRDTTDAPAILRSTPLRDVLFDTSQTVQCPVFKSVVDWIGTKTGIPGY